MPPNSSSGSGKAEATYDTETKTLTYTVTYAGLTGPAMGAHFHGSVEAGKNAGAPSKAARLSPKLRLRICRPESGTRIFIPP